MGTVHGEKGLHRGHRFDDIPNAERENGGGRSHKLEGTKGEGYFEPSWREYPGLLGASLAHHETTSRQLSRALRWGG